MNGCVQWLFASFNSWQPLNDTSKRSPLTSHPVYWKQTNKSSFVKQKSLRNGKKKSKLCDSILFYRWYLYNGTIDNNMCARRCASRPSTPCSGQIIIWKIWWEYIICFTYFHYFKVITFFEIIIITFHCQYYQCPNENQTGTFKTRE